MRFTISFLLTLPFVICMNIASACVAIMCSMAPLTSPIAVLMILGLVFVSLHVVVFLRFSAIHESLNESEKVKFNSLTYGVGSCVVLVFPASLLLWLPVMPLALEYLHLLGICATLLIVSPVWLAACYGGWYIVVRKLDAL